jgi:hypothetical protein
MEWVLAGETKVQEETCLLVTLSTKVSSCHEVNNSARAMLEYQRLSPGTMDRIVIEIYEKFDNYPLLSQSWRLCV